MDFIAEDFPFTAHELRSALALAYPAAEATRLSAQIIALGQKASEEPSSPRPKNALAHRAADRATVLVPPSIWALLAASSAALEQRCDEWRLRTRLASRAASERAVRQKEGLSMTDPMPSELISKLDEEDVSAEQDWMALLGQARILLAGRRSSPGHR